MSLDCQWESQELGCKLEICPFDRIGGFDIFHLSHSGPRESDKNLACEESRGNLTRRRFPRKEGFLQSVPKEDRQPQPAELRATTGRRGQSVCVLFLKVSVVKGRRLRQEAEKVSQN